MSMLDVLEACRARGIQLALRNGGLLMRDPHGRLDAALREQLALHKPAIIQWLATPIEKETPIPLVDRHERLALSFAQQRLWLVSALDKDADRAYYLPSALRLRGTLDRAALQHALDGLVARHESLRTRFVTVDGVPYQEVVSPAPAFALREQHAASEQGVTQAIADELNMPFDLANGPLVRGRLLSVSEQEHVLLLTLHHIVSDGWSSAVMVRELATLYRAACLGEADSLPPLPIQYVDYAHWQRQQLQGARLSEQLDFWRGHLAGAPELLELPLDRPRPPTPSHAGGQCVLSVPAPLAEGLRALAQRHGATLYMVLMAAWSLLLSRLSGQSTVVVATPVAGRGRRELEGLIGFFVNTLALCTRLDDEQSVAQLIDAVRHATLAAFTHQELPFEQVVEAVRPARSLSHAPLAQASFTWHNEPEGQLLALPELSLQAIDIVHPSTQADLSLHLSDAGATLEGRLVYARDLFDEMTVARWGRCFLRVLESFVADETQPALRVPLLAQDDYRQVVDDFNLVPPATPSAGLAHACFERWVDAQGDVTALSCEGDTLSYRELDERANRLAHYLLVQGTQPDDRVALCVERGLDFLVGVLGILKAGGAYVPLDPEYPSARLAYMLGDSAPRLVLTQSSVAEQLPPVDVPVLRLDVDVPVLTRHLPSTRPELPALQPSHLAYLIYTSGSTGEPKAVMVEHRQLCHLSAAQQAVFGDLHGARVLQFASLSFDASVWEWAMALLAGGTLVLAPRHRLLPGDALLASLRDHAITHVTLPGSALQTLGEAELPSLRTLVVAGEACPVALAERWRERVAFFNAYGPTEGTVCASIERCLETHAYTVPIGRPLPNTRLHVLDARGEVVPVGVVGEIHLGGAGVTRGYWGREALTAERFIDDRVGASGARLYRTGDLGRYRADGRLECLGRVDFQVKLRGHRIEIGEIETRLEALPGVAEAAVLLEGEGASARLVAYWTPAGEAEESAASLRAQLASRLPDYMLPSALVRLAQLPRTGNGKLDRAALPTHESGAVAQREYEAPQGEVEETLARLWQELLEVPRVGRHDHFFELGGHSLLAVQLASRLREALGVEMPLKLLFGAPTLEALATSLPMAQTPEPALRAVARDRRMPLSLAQQRLWFVDRFDRQASLSYHLPLALRLAGTLDLQTLKASLTRIWERHEILRSFFPDEGGVPYLGFLDTPLHLPEQDLSILPVDARPSALAEVAAQEARAPFDFAREPLIRARLLRMADDEHVLLVTMHHIISDGWSLAVLVRELGALYPALQAGHADPLPPLPVQYADYALWQRERMQGERLTQDTAFWRGHLAGAPSLIDLPLDRARPPLQDHHGERVFFDCPAELARDLHAFADRHGATLYMVLLAGWAITLSRISGQDDLVIGTPVAGRQRREVEDLIGFFVNTLALRVRIEAGASVASIVAAVKDTALAAFAHQDLPFEQVVEAVQPERSLSHAALAQASFTWHNEPTGGTLVLPGLSLAPIEQASVDTHFDLSLHLTDLGDRLSGLLVYASALFERDTIERVADLLVQVLRGMVAAETTAAGALTLLDPAHGSAQIPPHPEVPRLHGERVHQRFEQWVETQPNAPALTHAGEVLSYGELNARANALAHHLRATGLGPDQRVAIVAERGFAFVTAVLAVLKAGGAYVPLDPALPRARLAHILAECEPHTLLIESEAEDALPPLDVPVLRLDTDLPLLARRLPQANLSAHAGANARDLCYVIYTSGSTGMPKGVMVEHPNVLNMALAHGEWLGLSAQDRVLQFAALSFDVCAADIFMALTHGACLCLNNRDELQPGGPLERTLREQRISVAMLPVAALGASVHTALPELRCLVVGGDVCPPALAERWRQGRQLFNVYGPTEATVAASAYLCTDTPVARLPIGRALNNARLYVLDERQQPVPVGVVGEICIGGAGIARGYLGREDETAARFLPDPFHAQASARMYRSGDLGRWRADGSLEFLGRRDQQVKIRGFRIELGEIEGHLLACAGVREAAVTVHERGSQRQLVAYIAALDGAGLEQATLRSALGSRLPDYMQPTAYLFIERLPLTVNGKLDRAALPVPQSDDWGLRAYAAPEGEVEQTVARIWQELLDQPQVGRHDHFFDLGGHSLLVVALVERLREQGLIGEVRAIFGAPTLAEYAAGLSRAQVEDALPQDESIPAGTTRITPDLLDLVTLSQGEIDHLGSLVPGGAGNIKDVYPLMPLQEGMLFHHLMETRGDTYLSRSQVAFDSRSRLDRFLRALDEVIGRHDILRCAFLWEGLPRPVQVVQRQASLPVYELQVDAGEDAIAFLDARTDPRQIQLDLRRAPLLAAYVVEDRARGEWLLSLLYHHILGDRTASELIRGELGRHMRSESTESVASPSLRALIAQANSVDPAQYETYFRHLLAGVDDTTAPFGVLNTHQTSTDLRGARRELPDALAAMLRECARMAQVSTTTLFHVAFARVLGACAGRDDVVFGTVLSGRLQGARGADRAVGMFINMLPVRFRLHDVTVADAVQDAYRQLLALLEHEQAPLALAQRCSELPSTLPLFTSMFNYRHSRGTAAVGQAVPEMDGIRVLHTEEAMNYPLSMSVDDDGRHFVLTAQCVSGIDPVALCAYLESVLVALAGALSTTAPQPLGTLPILPKAERAQLLDTFNATTAPYPREALIHELFEQQAASRPEAVAVACDTHGLSYGELNARANRVAHYLIAQGIGADDRVAICCERSAELIVGLLGILKAGGAYVPLDPDHPPERLAFMLEDSAPKLLLTQSALQARLPELVIPRLALDACGTALDAYPVDNPRARRQGLAPHHLAYVIYTSGSTGTPKGVMVEHRSVLRLVMQDRYVSIGTDDGVAHCANPAFDAATWEIWATLLHGARLLVITPACLLDPVALGQQLTRERATVLHLTAGLFHQYADQLSDSFPRLNYLLFGGDRIHADKVRRVLDGGRHAHLVQCYGPTETTTFASTFEVRELAADAASVSIGTPIANTQIYILDAHGEPAPIGAAGEIHIGGDGVARGYLNRDTLTAERFLKDPFRADPRARMYKTGDLGRWLPDGNIEYLGRNDFQVKLRGFRIELGEIEAKLAACAGIREAVVLAREDIPGDKRLVAYLVAVADTEISIALLRTELLALLPEYMVPSAFVLLDGFPLTPNGKLDRKALPVPDGSAIAQRAYEAPQGDVEETLAGIWQQLLHVERVGRHDHFFELGGHSLLLVRLLMRIQEAFGVELALPGLFEAPTLYQLADRIVQAELALYDDKTRNEMDAALAGMSAEQLRAMLTDSEEEHERA